MAKCPHCGRELIKHERYCYHCELDVSKAADEAEKPDLPKPKPYNFKKDVEEYRDKAKIIGRIIKNIMGKKKPKISAYCVKCRKKVDIKNPEEYTMKNNFLSIKGVCPICSTKVFRIIGKK